MQVQLAEISKGLFYLVSQRFRVKTIGFLFLKPAWSEFCLKANFKAVK